MKDPFLKVPSARALLECGAINRLVTDYIGDDAIYQNVFLTRSPAGIDMHDYSGLRHHDKVVHRLKVFFLLEDVGEDGRPTMYATGSHLLDWPDYYYQASRFREAFVLDHFTCGAMVAGRGDCTIFDTNGLHRAVYDAGRSVRSALVLEFASKSKFRAFQELGNFPIGVKMHHLSKGLNTDRTLVDTALITDTYRGMLYGGPWPAGIYPNFN